MGSNAITMYRGDTKPITISVTDSEGTAFDLTDYTMRLTVKTNVRDLDADAKIGPLTATVASPANGVGIVQITEVHSNIPEGTYIFDVQITNTDESTNYTIIKDHFKINEGVTDISD